MGWFLVGVLLGLAFLTSGGGVVKDTDPSTGAMSAEAPAVPRPSPQASQSGLTSALVGGKATHYAYVEGQAAAGPVLREALGGDPAFRGKRVQVCTDEACVSVVLTDWCACGDRGGVPTVIDLDKRDFAKLAPLSRGVISVTVEVPGSPGVTLPPTDMEG